MIEHPLDFANKLRAVFTDIDVAAVASEVVEIKEDLTLTVDRSDQPAFWQSMVRYPQMKDIAVRILSMFGSTYVCESGFSRMNFIKNKYRSALTDAHLLQLMRIAMTDITPDFQRIARAGSCHFSH